MVRNRRLPVRMATTPRFGIFSPLFNSASGYLALLNLGSPTTPSPLSEVLNCCRSVDNPYKEVVSLLEVSNWRPHLVAAVAISLLRYESTSVTSLWGAFDSGSWVSPQLAAVACLRDPDFLAHARVRIAMRCPLETTKLMSLSPLQRHTAYGPAGGRQRSAKAAASLMQLVSVLRPVPEWWLKEQSSPDLVALLSEDVDQSARIAEQWLLQLKAHLKTLGVENS